MRLQNHRLSALTLLATGEFTARSQEDGQQPKNINDRRLLVESTGVKMNDAVLQVLLILAFLAIGLISVTFPIYAISVNFLPQQKWENEKERKKRMEELKAKISELTVQLGGQDSDTETKMREQLDKYEAEKKGTELRYQYLTARGAVGIPVVLLVLSLLFAVFGIYGFYIDSQGAISLGVLSALFSAVALYRLYKTISAVEYGALRPERTVEFVVGFGEKYEKRISIELRKTTSAKLVVKPESEIENLFIQVDFPAELELGRKTNDPSITITEYEDVTVYGYTEVYIPKESGIGFSFSMTPKKKGEYTAKVSVCAKRIYEYHENLTIEVV